MTTAPASRLSSLRNPRVQLAALLIFAAFVRFPTLAYRGLWTDELSTLEAVRLSTTDLIRDRAENGHFPTYFLSLRMWTRLAGESEWALRFPSAVLALLSIPFLYWAARRAWGARVALFAALFYLLNERMLWASQEARPYALVLLAAAGAFHALLRALEDGRRRWWAAYAGWTLLGFLSHSTYVFIALAQTLTVGAWLVRARRRRRDWAIVTLALGTAAAAALTALHRFQTNAGFYGTRGWPAWEVWRGGVLQLFWGEYDNLFGSGFKYVGLPLAAVVMALAWRGRRQVDVKFVERPSGRMGRMGPMGPIRPEGRTTNSDVDSLAFALAATWTFSILVGMALVSGLWRDVVGGYRYYAGGLGGAALLQGLAVGNLRSTRWRRTLLAICLAIQGAVTFGWLRGPGEQIREAIRYVADHRAPDEPVVFCDDSHADTLTGYYRLGVAPIAVSRDVKDRAQIERLLETNLRASPGFWIILYKEEKSPLESVARSWTHGRFDLADDRKLRAVRVLAFRRILNSSVE